MLSPVILSGGSGSRLWPLSRLNYPKQFLPLMGYQSMLQDASARALGELFREPVVVCNEEHRFLVADQLREAGIEPDRILLEPEGRNTAPAVAIAAMALLDRYDEALMLVMPSDHVIRDHEAFMSAVARARPAADMGHLVTFGITPDKPETGYGYIERDDRELTAGVHAVRQFLEKPDRDTAQHFMSTGHHLWNSGVFLFQASAYLAELQRHRPEMMDACEKAFHGGESDLFFCRPNQTAFRHSPADSIDYAVMEHTDHAAVAPVEMGWSDLGTWSTLWEVGDKDSDENVTRGDTLTYDTQGSYVHSEGLLVATAGVSNLIVVATDDAVLVADRDNAQDVKAVVDLIKAKGRDEASLHSEVHRPWGAYRGIDKGDRHQVKRITVKPGQKLSSQMHHHRAEHWVVVKGTARVTIGNDSFLLKENESTYIPLGEVHRLENPGKVTLHLIEVQSGSYLGEDDIVRFDDVYGRVASE